MKGGLIDNFVKKFGNLIEVEPFQPINGYRIDLISQSHKDFLQKADGRTRFFYEDSIFRVATPLDIVKNRIKNP